MLYFQSSDRQGAVFSSKRDELRLNLADEIGNGCPVAT
jgi:hypothetical protein